MVFDLYNIIYKQMGFSNLHLNKKILKLFAVIAVTKKANQINNDLFKLKN